MSTGRTPEPPVSLSCNQLALVGDPDDASDLTQEAFEVALTQPPRKPGPLRPWLGGVVRNLARMRRRSAGRRREREQKVELAGPEGVPTPDQLVDRARAQQRVARGVLELDEPYRSTVLLRYYEGLPSAEIARRQSLPAATVRARLRTGLDRLRAELDSDDRLGGRGRWCALLAPLAAADPTAVASSASLVKGALAVKTSSKIVAVVIALLVVGYAGGHLAGWWGSSTSSSPVEASVAGNGDAAGAPALGRAALARPGDVNAAISEDDPVGDLRLEGQVIDDQERPVAGATVVIDSHPTRTVTTEGDGSFVFDKLIGRDYEIEASSRDAYAGPVSLRLGAETEPVILRVRAVMPIEIAVVDRDGGKPIAGAEVELRSHMVWAATTGDDGVASFGGVGAHDPTIRVNAEGYAPVTGRLISFGRREQRIVIAMSAGAAVSGRITDTAGEPIAGARVIAASTSGGHLPAHRLGRRLRGCQLVVDCRRRTHRAPRHQDRLAGRRPRARVGHLGRRGAGGRRRRPGGRHRLGELAQRPPRLHRGRRHLRDPRSGAPSRRPPGLGAPSDRFQRAACRRVARGER